MMTSNIIYNLTELAEHIRIHMASFNGEVSSDSYFVQIRSRDIPWSGIFIDTPGIVLNPDGTTPDKRERENRIRDEVIKILREKLKTVNLKLSIVLCVDTLKLAVCPFSHSLAAYSCLA